MNESFIIDSDFYGLQQMSKIVASGGLRGTLRFAWVHWRLENVLINPYMYSCGISLAVRSIVHMLCMAKVPL